MAFRFLDPGRLVDGELELVLVRRDPGDDSWDWSPTYIFEMRHTIRGVRMGTISLRIGHTENLEKYAGHIGYYVSPPYRGHRYAARSCRLLLPLAKQHGINPVWITCNPDNLPSRRTCEIVGAVYVETVPVPRDHILYLQGDRYKCRYRVDL